MDDTIQVAKLKAKINRLERDNMSAFRQVEKFMKENKDQKEKIVHLENMLTKNVPVLIEDKVPQKTVSFLVTSEEEIAEMQIERLKDLAKDRLLSLEETRQYDLFIKNKRLLQKESTINVGKESYQKITDADLIELVGKNEKN